MDVPEVRNRPMPNSKKKELLTKALINSAIVIPAAEGLQISVRPQKPTLIIYSDDDEEEEDGLSDSETSSTAGEGLDQPPTNLPESVDIDVEDTEPENEECHETVDALGGADVFGDVPVEQDVDLPAVAEEQEGDIVREASLLVEGLLSEEAAAEEIKPPPSVSSSESSVDLADVAFNFTPEEMRAIRRKRKRERREAKKNQLVIRKRRERELALAKKDRFFDKSRIIPNEIYFGDIVVPLHVLHTYGHQEGREKGTQGASKQKHNSQTSHKVHGTSPRPGHVLRKSADGTNPRIEMYKRYLKVAGIRQRTYKSLVKRCTDDMQVINVMLRVLREHGLVGDPTIAKCRELRRNRDDDVSDDGEGLDTSAIINTDGRLLRNGKKVRQDAEVLEERGPQLASQGPSLDAENGPEMGVVDVAGASLAEKTE